MGKICKNLGGKIFRFAKGIDCFTEVEKHSSEGNSLFCEI